MTVSYDDIIQSAQRIRAYVHKTPILQSETLNRECGVELYFKSEHLQKVGAFKARGAVNAVFALPAEVASLGVATHSSGNHGAALARAAALRNIEAHIVIPENAKAAKVAAIESYGGQVTRCESTLQARENALAEVLRKTGATLIHPYNNESVISGQGTTALEIIEQVEALDAIITPVGGGGLLAGSATVAKSKGIAIYGAEPEMADDAYRSFKSGQRVTDHVPKTIADGLQTTLGELNFEIIRSNVNDIFLVSEAEIVDAMQLIWSRLKQVVEPSAAVTLAAIRRNPNFFKGKKVCLVLTGGNVDLANLPF